MEKLKFVTLNADQIAQVKAIHGSRTRPTHAIVCGDLGQMFGTKKQMSKYYTSWSQIYPYLFDGGVEIDDYAFANYETTYNLSTILYDVHRPIEVTNKINAIEKRRKVNAKKAKLGKRTRSSKKGFLSLIISMVFTIFMNKQKRKIKKSLLG